MDIKTIYSLRELHKLLENHHDKKRLMIFFDLDLTIIREKEGTDGLDELIEPEVTKKLFQYIMKHKIYFCFVTARFYNTVCNEKKRNLKEIEHNLYTTIFPVLEELGIDITPYKNKELADKCHVIKNDRNVTIAALYRGVFFSNRKGEAIKFYRQEFSFDKTHTHTIFVDDHDPYLNSVIKNIPDCLVIKREIK